MTAATRKQGACFPGELWEQIKRTADSQKTTPSKVIVQAVREMMDRKTKRGEKK